MSLFFVFIWYLNGVILSEKSCQKQGVQKKYRKGEWPYTGGCLEKEGGGGFQTSHYERIKSKIIKDNIGENVPRSEITEVGLKWTNPLYYCKQ